MTPAAPPIILGSGSPRRADLLTLLGVAFDVIVPGVHEPGDATVDELARLKFDHLARSYDGRTIITADTLVLLDATQLGKPHDPDHARDMLRQCSGRAITVASAICVGTSERVASAHVETTVQLRELTDTQIEQYLATGVANDKAGALALQSRAADFVDTASPYFAAACADGGCYSNVVGLPLCITADYLGIARRSTVCQWPAR